MALDTPLRSTALQTNRSGGYNDVFDAYINASAQIVLNQLHDNSHSISSELKAQALLTLSYTLRKAGTWSWAKEILLVMAPKMEQAALWDEWLPYLERGITTSRQVQDPDGNIQLALHLGRLHRLRGAFAPARQWLKHAATQAEIVRDGRSQALAFNQLAYVARLQSCYSEAHAYVTQALAHLDADDTERATSFWVLGTMAQDQKEWAQAIRHHTSALEIWQRVGNRQRAAWSLQNLGDTFRQMGYYDEAARHLRESICLLEQLQDRVNHAIACMNLGVFHVHQDQPDEALALFTLAEKVFREAGDPLHLAMVNNNLAVARRMQQAWLPAIQAAQASVYLWEALGDAKSLVNTLGELGLAYQGAGNIDEAIAIFERALVVLRQVPAGSAYAALQAEITEYLQTAQALQTGQSASAQTLFPAHY
jgi:tetratricopeptide (TPR) repeat protein